MNAQAESARDARGEVARADEAAFATPLGAAELRSLRQVCALSLTVRAAARAACAPLTTTSAGACRSSRLFSKPPSRMQLSSFVAAPSMVNASTTSSLAPAVPRAACKASRGAESGLGSLAVDLQLAKHRQRRSLIQCTSSVLQPGAPPLNALRVRPQKERSPNLPPALPPLARPTLAPAPMENR